MEKTGQKHTKPILIGITGNIGAGKSTIIKFLKNKDSAIIDLDKLGHQILKKEKIKKDVVKLFGKYVLTKNQLDRKKIGRIVFYNNDLLERYNKLIHPFLVKALQKEIKKLQKKKKYKYIIIDAALIYEMHIDKLVDKIILVRTNKYISFFRLLRKKNISFRTFNHIYNSQLSPKLKKEKADYIIKNNLPLKFSSKLLKKKLEKILKNIENVKSN